MTTKDKKFRYESFAERPSISKEKIDKAFYELVKPIPKGDLSGRNRNRDKTKLYTATIKDEPFYSDEYMDLMLDPLELDDVKQQLDVSPMVRFRTKEFNNMVLNNAKEKAKRPGLPSILMVDASNKPPTLEDYLRLGITISQLSKSERESIQWMLDRSIPKPEDTK